jgi:glutathione peroxidase
MAQSLYDIPLQKIDGSKATLAEHKGDVLLVVNVASKCGLTPQYTGLEKLHETYRDRGFKVLGFPANDFGAQEPGTNAEIQQFCTTNFGVQFPMYSKIQVTGSDKHPLYAQLTSAQPATAGRDVMEKQLKGYGMSPTSAPEVLWNFEKFLVDRSGRVVGRFAPDTAPDAAPLVNAIEGELAKKA